MKRLRNWWKEIKGLISDPMVSILPGQIAFFLILSIFPLLILVGWVASFFDISVGTITEMISSALPQDIAKSLIDFISGKSFDTTIGLSMMIGFFLASNGSYAIITASNALYGFPADDFVKRRVKAIFLIFILVVLLAFTLAVLTYGNSIAKLILANLNESTLANALYWTFFFARWPLAMILIYFAIKLIYVIAPDWQILSKNTTKGSLFTTFGWIVATIIFSYYISHFANYDIFYGSLSSIVILMLWIYVISYILVLGIAINVKEYRDKEE